MVKKSVVIVSLSTLVSLFLLLIFLLWFSLPRLFNLNKYKHQLTHQLEEMTNGKVSLGDISLSIFPRIRIRCKDLSLRRSEEVPSFVSAEAVYFSLDLFPLLSNEIIWHEVELFRPTVILHRDRQGTINLAEFVKDLPRSEDGLSDEDAIAPPQTSQQLQKISIQEGKAFLIDELPQESPIVIKLDDFYLEMTDLSFRDSFPFSLKVVLKTPSSESPISLTGEIIDIPEDRNILKAFLAIKGELQSLDPTPFRPYLEHYTPIRSLTGLFDATWEYSGTLSGPFHTKGTIEIRDSWLDFPKRFREPVPIRTGRLDYSLHLEENTLTVPSIQFNINEFNVHCSFSVTDIGKENMAINLLGNIENLSLESSREFVLIKHFPEQLCRFIKTRLLQGRISRCRLKFKGPIEKFHNLKDPDNFHLITIKGELEDCLVKIDKDLPPVKNISGHVSLSNGDIDFTDFKGVYKSSAITKVYSRLSHVYKDPDITLQIAGTYPYEGLRDILTSDFLNLFPFLEFMPGKGPVTSRFTLSFPLKHRNLFNLEGTAQLNDVQFAIGSFFPPIRKYHGNIRFSHQGVRFDPASARMGEHSLSMMGEIDQFDPPRLHLHMTDRCQTSNKVKSSACWKPVKFLPPVSEFNGTFQFVRNGLSLSSGKALLQYGPVFFTLSLEDYDNPFITFAAQAPHMELLQKGTENQHLQPSPSPANIPLEETSQGAEKPVRFQAQGDIYIGSGKLRDIQFSDLAANILWDGEAIRLKGLSSWVAGGMMKANGWIRPDSDNSSFNLSTRLIDAEIKSLAPDAVRIDGNLNFHGQFTGQAGKNELLQHLSGKTSFQLENGTISRFSSLFNVLIKLSSYLSLSNLLQGNLPDLTRSGIQYKSMKGDFVLTEGVAATENFSLDSKALNFLGKGSVDLNQKTFDLTIGVPLALPASSLLKIIPGLNILVSEDASLMTAYFNAQGPWEEPVVDPVPDIRMGERKPESPSSLDDSTKNGGKKTSDLIEEKR